MTRYVLSLKLLYFLSSTAATRRSSSGRAACFSSSFCSARPRDHRQVGGGGLRLLLRVANLPLDGSRLLQQR